MLFLVTETLETSLSGFFELPRLNSYHMLLRFNKFLQLMKAGFFSFPLPPAVCCSGWWRPASLPRSSWTWPFWTRREWLGYRQLSGWTQVVQWPIRNNIQSVQQWAFEHIWGKGILWWKFISHWIWLRPHLTWLLAWKPYGFLLDCHQKTLSQLGASYFVEKQCLKKFFLRIRDPTRVHYSVLKY